MWARVVIFSALLLGGASLCAQAEQTSDLTSRVAALHPPNGLLGAVSCSATACHGGSRPGAAVGDRPRGAEHATWLGLDPHARAASKLTTARSRRILQNLGAVENGRILDKVSFQNCLNCHGPSDTVSVSAPQSRSTLSRSSRPSIEPAPASTLTTRGVDCEACHGPARDWIGLHASRVRGGASLPSMMDTGALLTRARVCVDCHVGAADRDVNHDLIAAGHPALRFELSQYHSRLPKHWRESAARQPGFRARLWLAGQIAASEASLALTAARADDASPSVWPEFAEFQCSACHQRLPAEPTSRRNGAAWADWNQTVLPRLAKTRDDNESAKRFADNIRQLSTEVQRSDFGRRDRVFKLAESTRASLNEWLATNSLLTTVEQGDALPSLLREATASPALSSWEFATQLFLGAVALRREQQREDSAWRSSVANVNQLLRFPPPADGPAWPTGSASKDDETQRRLRQVLQELLQ